MAGGSWASNAEDLVRVGVVLGFGFGIMGYALGTFLTVLGSGAGYNFVNAILGAFSTAITTILPAVISIAFILLLWVMLVKTGIIHFGDKPEQ